MNIITQLAKKKKSTNHDDAMVAELRENPEYAQIYLQTALEDLHENDDISFLIALRRVVEMRDMIIKK